MSTPPSPPSSAPDRPRLPWDPPDHFEKRVPEGDNRERLVCARCEFIHYQNPKIVAGAVCTWGTRILLAKRAIEPRKGFGTLPAGYMELGETAELAAGGREGLRQHRSTVCWPCTARIGQVQTGARAFTPTWRLAWVSEEVAVDGRHSRGTARLQIIVARWRFLQSRDRVDATYSNPRVTLRMRSLRSGRGLSAARPTACVACPSHRRR
jgi:hypothetical protein